VGGIWGRCGLGIAMLRGRYWGQKKKVHDLVMQRVGWPVGRSGGRDQLMTPADGRLWRAVDRDIRGPAMLNHWRAIAEESNRQAEPACLRLISNSPKASTFTASDLDRAPASLEWTSHGESLLTRELAELPRRAAELRQRVLMRIKANSSSSGGRRSVGGVARAGWRVVWHSDKATKRSLRQELESC